MKRTRVTANARPSREISSGQPPVGKRSLSRTMVCRTSRFARRPSMTTASPVRSTTWRSYNEASWRWEPATARTNYARCKRKSGTSVVEKRPSLQSSQVFGRRLRLGRRGDPCGRPRPLWSPVPAPARRGIGQHGTPPGRPLPPLVGLGHSPAGVLEQVPPLRLSQVSNRTASALDGARPPSSAIRAWREAHCRRGRPRTLDGQSPLVAAEIVVLDNVISTRLLWPDSESPVNNQYALRVIRQAQNRNGHDVPTTWH